MLASDVKLLVSDNVILLQLKAKATALAIKVAREQGFDRNGRVITEGDEYFG